MDKKTKDKIDSLKYELNWAIERKTELSDQNNLLRKKLNEALYRLRLIASNHHVISESSSTNQGQYTAACGLEIIAKME